MKSVLRFACALSLSFSAACLDESTSERSSELGDDDDVVCIELYPDCPDGEAPADTDGDGCALECAPIACPAIAVECPPGQVPADTNNDGCALECADADEPVVCPAYIPDCPAGEVPMDLDGDGCALECGELCGNNP